MIIYDTISAAHMTIIVGLLLLAIEIWILGLSTIVLLALGVSAIIIGAIASLWIPMSVPVLIGLSGIGAGLLTALLWRPLKKIQQASPPQQNIVSDFVGLTFVLDSDLSMKTPSVVHYSGIRWQLKLAHEEASLTLKKGTSITVIAVDVGTFIVQASPEYP